MRREGFIERILSKRDKLSRSAMEDILLEVAQERDYFQVVLDSLVEGVIATDEDGVCTFLNTAARRLLGIRDEDATGQALLSLVPDAGFREIGSKCLQTGDRVLWQEIHVSTPIARILLLSVIPIRKGSKRLKGVVFIFHDVTEKKESERELARTQKLAEMTTLAARLSHELRNPLNNLNIYTQLAERDLRSIEKNPGDVKKISYRAGENLKIVREEIDRLNTVLEDFLNAVRPTRPIVEEFNVYELIEGTIRLLQPELESRQIEVSLDAECGDGVTILADEGQIRRAILNVVKNAAEAVGSKGILRIVLDHEDSDVVIKVRDNGPGIPEEIRDLIFEPYYTTKEDGSGLGLVTVKRVIEDHGGKVSVRSRPGEGAEFEIRIPRRRDGHRMLPLHGASPQREITSPEDK